MEKINEIIKNYDEIKFVELCDIVSMTSQVSSESQEEIIGETAYTNPMLKLFVSDSPEGDLSTYF